MAACLKAEMLLEKVLTTDGKTIALWEQDGSYAIRVDGQQLMATGQHASEERLAELACAHLAGKSRARVLIGGLGFGYTLRAALGVLAADATVVVVEILAPVIAWNRNPAFLFAPGVLDDPRVAVVRGDAGEVIGAARAEFDSITLDVDNGPVAMSADGNARLYERSGLKSIRGALRPQGCVAVWSAGPDAVFESRLRQAHFAVEVRHCRAREKTGRWHTIILGWRE
jgi:spermidine synthase